MADLLTPTTTLHARPHSPPTATGRDLGTRQPTRVRKEARQVVRHQVVVAKVDSKRIRVVVAKVNTKGMMFLIMLKSTKNLKVQKKNLQKAHHLHQVVAKAPIRRKNYKYHKENG